MPRPSALAFRRAAIASLLVALLAGLVQCYTPPYVTHDSGPRHDGAAADGQQPRDARQGDVAVTDTLTSDTVLLRDADLTDRTALPDASTRRDSASLPDTRAIPDGMSAADHTVRDTASQVDAVTTTDAGAYLDAARADRETPTCNHCPSDCPALYGAMACEARLTLEPFQRCGYDEDCVTIQTGVACPGGVAPSCPSAVAASQLAAAEGALDGVRQNLCDCLQDGPSLCMMEIMCAWHWAPRCIDGYCRMAEPPDAGVVDATTPSDAARSDLAAAPDQSVRSDAGSTDQGVSSCMSCPTTCGELGSAMMCQGRAALTGLKRCVYSEDCTTVALDVSCPGGQASLCPQLVNVSQKPAAEAALATIRAGICGCMPFAEPACGMMQMCANSYFEQLVDCVDGTCQWVQVIPDGGGCSAPDGSYCL